MGLLDNVFEKSEPRELTRQDAYAGILLAANASDGHVSDEEVQGFFNILVRMKMFRDFTQERLQQTIDRMLGLIKRKGAQTTAELCGQVLPEGLRRPVFANACDLILADGVVEDEEKEFINHLRKVLNISGDDAQTIAQVMVWKNQG